MAGMDYNNRFAGLAFICYKIIMLQMYKNIEKSRLTSLSDLRITMYVPFTKDYR